MKDIILDTLIDLLKLLPFLFIAFFIMEYIEHKLSKKSKKLVEKSGKYGPFIGSILGAFPQCGFSVSATNLYATKIITLGTLISIYLSTSDEMLPILISEGINISFIIKTLLLKILIGMLSGVIIDYIFKKNNNKYTSNGIEHFCDEEHCDCKHNILLSVIKHTLSIGIFIMFISFILNIGMEYLGNETINHIFMKNSLFGPFITSLVGLIPNCAASVAITELYLNGSITYGSMLSGLLTGSGVALLVLFKVNKNIKENIKIFIITYGIGVIAGIIIDLIGLL